MTAWGVLIAQLQRDLIRRARPMTRKRRGAGFPSEEDLAQTTIASLLAAYGEAELQSRPIGQLYQLAYRTLHNRFLDELKRRREALWRATQTSTGAHEAVSSGPSPEQLAFATQTQTQVNRCMGDLAPEARRFLVCSFESGSATEAQREIGWPPGSTSNACHLRRRLIRALQQCLERAADQPQESA